MIGQINIRTADIPQIALILGLMMTFISAQAQQKAASLENTAFSEAVIQWNGNTQLPEDIKLDADSRLTREDFIADLRNTFEISDQMQFEPGNEYTGPIGDQHIRYSLRYNGLELSHTRFLLHLKDNRVVHAHGRLVNITDIEDTPSLTREEAFTYACKHLGISKKEAKKNSLFLSILSDRPDKLKDSGQLILSCGMSEKTGRNYRLAYRFDMTTTDPLQRFDIEVDAQTGEIIGKFPTLLQENIATTGRSLYNDTVDIVVSDSLSLNEGDFSSTYWHLDGWNAYQDSGVSWWMADTVFFSPGGYINTLHQAMTTDPIILSGSNPTLEFYHRYNLELPEGASDYDERYDGWDGINVRISPDDGTTWMLLTDPQPAYTCNSLWSFGEIHHEGPGIQGWAGKESAWTQVTIDLSDYRSDTVLIRYEFASDAGFSTLDDNNLFGWQIDNIKVYNDSNVLFTNSGEPSNINTQNLFKWVGFIEGKFRLRETTRGDGIATYNAGSGEGFASYIDFVQDSLPILNEENMSGVGIHWATEKSYDFFMETFNRNSFDNNGSAIISYADWTEGVDVYENAFWSGSFAAYGAGDGVGTGSFGTIDIVGHEITHGVTQYSANLIYWGESGALNESFSDIFGTAVEFYAEGEDKGDWTTGEDLFVKGEGAIRSLENPKRYSDPDTYLGEYWFNVNENEDNGGVHTNSGVQNHWFYLLSEGGTDTNDDRSTYNVTGIGLKDATAIAYRNLISYLLPDTKYVEASMYSIQAARDLFGDDSRQVQSTTDAWEAVGIYQNPRLFNSDSLILEAALGSSASKNILLRNKGMKPVTINDFQLVDSSGFSISTSPSLPLILESFDTAQLRVTFSPSYEGLHQSTLTISSTDPVNPERMIHLAGVGIAPANTLVPGERSAENGMSVYPNPANNELTIQSASSHRMNIIITSLNGQHILHQEFEGTTHQLDISTLQKGFYFVTIIAEDFVVTKKVVKL